MNRYTATIHVDVKANNPTEAAVIAVNKLLLMSEIDVSITGPGPLDLITLPVVVTNLSPEQTNDR